MLGYLVIFGVQLTVNIFIHLFLNFQALCSFLSLLFVFVNFCASKNQIDINITNIIYDVIIF